MTTELTERLRVCAKKYDKPPFGREVDGTKELLEEAAARIEELERTADNNVHENVDTASMTAEGYNAYRLEMTRRALMALNAKLEAPYGNELSEILSRAIDEVEALQEASREEST